MSRSQFKAEFARIVSSSTFDLYCEETREKFIKLEHFSKANIPDELFRFRKCGIEDLIAYGFLIRGRPLEGLKRVRVPS